MKKKEMLSIDTLGFDVSYRILSYCWVQETLRLSCCNKALYATCTSAPVLRDLLISIMLRSGRYVRSLSWYLQMQGLSGQDLLQLISSCSTYPYGWDKFLIDAASNFESFDQWETVVIKEVGNAKSKSESEELQCNALVATLRHKADCSKHLDSIKTLPTPGNSVGFSPDDVGFSPDDVVYYYGNDLGGDRCIIASDPFPYYSGRCAASVGSVASFTRVAWSLPPGFVPSEQRRPLVDSTIRGLSGRTVHPEVMVPSLVLSRIAYYEVTMLPRIPVTGDPDHAEAQSCIAVGLCLGGFPLKCFMPGWSRMSVGLHSDDGQLHYGGGEFSGLTNTGLDRTFGEGDTVGCGVIYPPLVGPPGRRNDHGNIFFTINGVMCQDVVPVSEFLALDCIYEGNMECGDLTNADIPPGGLYPVVGIDSRNPVQMNVGRRPFVFDLDRFENRLKKGLLASKPAVLISESVTAADPTAVSTEDSEPSIDVESTEEGGTTARKQATPEERIDTCASSSSSSSSSSNNSTTTTAATTGNMSFERDRIIFDAYESLFSGEIVCDEEFWHSEDGSEDSSDGESCSDNGMSGSDSGESDSSESDSESDYDFLPIAHNPHQAQRPPFLSNILSLMKTDDVIGDRAIPGGHGAETSSSSTGSTNINTGSASSSSSTSTSTSSSSSSSSSVSTALLQSAQQQQWARQPPEDTLLQECGYIRNLPTGRKYSRFVVDSGHVGRYSSLWEEVEDYEHNNNFYNENDEYESDESDGSDNESDSESDSTDNSTFSNLS